MTILAIRYLAPQLATILTILTIFTLQLTLSVNVTPIIDGFASEGEYSNSMSVDWYNDHKPAGSKFPKGGGQKTAVYYDWSDSNFFLYLEAPLSAKNMIWGDGWTTAEAINYYQHWCAPSDGAADASHDGGSCGHHDDGFEKFEENKGDFGTMTGSEKTLFAGIKAGLNGKLNKKGKNNIVEYKDSVDYVVNSSDFDCDKKNCDASDVPMSFEFMFKAPSQIILKAY